jgi:hypothetical protein
MVQADARTGMPQPTNGALPPPAQMPAEKTEPAK